MNAGPYLERLLDGSDVEWLPLNSVAEYSKSRISADQVTEHNYVGVDNLLQNRGGRTDSNYVPSVGNLTAFVKGDILIGNIRPYLRKIWLADRSGGTNGDVLVIHPTDQRLSSAFLHQILTDEKFFEYNIKHSKGAKMPRGSKPLILKYLIPVPSPDDREKSLAIQEEIVRILNSFTALTAELTAELTARKKQYNYYRDQLLSFDQGKAEWKELGKLVHIKTGSSVNKRKIASNPGIYPVINSGREPLGYIDEWNTENDPIGVTTRGAGVGSVTWQEGRYFRGNLNYAVTVINKKTLSVRYLYHLLMNLQSDIHALCTFSGIPALNAGNLKLLRIPIPFADDPEKSLAEQARIVAILDKFDALTTSLSEGLPREIELREKQYAYYRDQLLSFPKTDEVAA